MEGEGQTQDFRLTLISSDLGGDYCRGPRNTCTCKRPCSGVTNLGSGLCEQGHRTSGQHRELPGGRQHHLCGWRRPHPYYCSSSTRSPPQQEWGSSNPTTEIPSGVSPGGPATCSTSQDGASPGSFLHLAGRPHPLRLWLPPAPRLASS